MTRNPTFIKARRDLAHAVTHASHHIMMRQAMRFNVVDEDTFKHPPIHLGKMFSTGTLDKLISTYGSSSETMRPMGEALSALCYKQVLQRLSKVAAHIARPGTFETVLLSTRDLDTWLSLYSRGQRPRFEFSNKDAKLAKIGNWTICCDSAQATGVVYYLGQANAVEIAEAAPVDADDTELVWPAAITIHSTLITKTIL